MQVFKISIEDKVLYILKYNKAQQSAWYCTTSTNNSNTAKLILIQSKLQIMENYKKRNPASITTPPLSTETDLEFYHEQSQQNKKYKIHDTIFSLK